MANVVIRKAAVADSEPIARLVSELGYPTATSQMQRRLETILDDEDYHTLVAYRDGQIVGFVGTRSGPLYEDDSDYGKIMALAVAPTHQRRGVGRMLMSAAESRLVERGVRVIVVTSGNHRSEAHAFYESCGYSFTRARRASAIALCVFAAGQPVIGQTTIQSQIHISFDTVSMIGILIADTVAHAGRQL